MNSPSKTDDLRDGCSPHTSPVTSSPDISQTTPGKTEVKNQTRPFSTNNYYENQKQQERFQPEVLEMFEKCYHYQKSFSPNDWSLPPAEELFTKYYQIKSLEELKIELNQVKSKLNDYDIENWSLHTKRQDPSGEITWRLKSETGAEFVTIAWCKMYECMGKFPDLVAEPKINSLHLCEAPGAFITALNHYLYTNYEKDEIQWNWLATTLNPYYEGNPYNKMIMDDRFLIYTLDNWLFHKDFTGNIIDKENITNMKEQCEQRLGNIKLITADGSIDCIDSPDCQEEKVAALHYAEIVSALTILADGGSFVVKMFTMFEASSVSKLYLLNCVFEKVSVFKPCTSKRGNSEVYVICINYKKNTKNLNEIIEYMKIKLNPQDSISPLFAMSVIPVDFLRQHEVCCRIFMRHQINAIENNIKTYEVKLPKEMTKHLQSLRKNICDEYYKRYNIKKLPNELKIYYKCHNTLENKYKYQLYKGSHSERVTFKGTPKEVKLFKLRKHFNEFEKTFKDHAATNVTQLEFKPEKENDNMKLNLARGKSFCILNSSLFVNVNLLNIRNNLNNLCELEPNDCLWFRNPRLEYNQGARAAAINFNDLSFTSSNFSIQQENFFKSVISALLKYKPKEIRFVNMPFLTHFAVSLLRYFSCLVYTKLTFSLDDNCEIVLSVCSEQFVSSLEEVNSALFSSLDQDILCFLKISQLHHNDFNKSLCSYNNTLLMQNYKQILNS